MKGNDILNIEIMKPEQKVITFEQAVIIAELLEKKGIELPEYQWIWCLMEDGTYDLLEREDVRYTNATFIPAYDIGEMMEIMKPGVVPSWETSTPDNWAANWIGENEDENKSVINKNLAEALGELLIYLIENDKLK